MRKLIAALGILGVAGFLGVANAAPPPPTMGGTAAPAQPSGVELRSSQVIKDRGLIKKAQLSLKDQGLYKGKVNGRETHAFHAALGNFQKKNALPETKNLDVRTAEALGIPRSEIERVAGHEQKLAPPSKAPEKNMKPQQNMPQQNPY